MRKKSLFNKKIFCGYCSKGAKRKKERGTVKYICSSYDNYGKCQRTLISEDRLKLALNRRFKKELSDEEIREVVLEVKFRSNRLFDIILSEGRPISYYENGIVF